MLGQGMISKLRRGVLPNPWCKFQLANSCRVPQSVVDLPRNLLRGERRQLSEFAPVGRYAPSGNCLYGARCKPEMIFPGPRRENVVTTWSDAQDVHII